MIERLLDKYRPRKEIYLNGDLYLKRWWVGEFLGRTYLLHKFCSEDQDRYLHTHPWHAWSLILWGSYQEDVVDNMCCVLGPVVKTRTKRWFNWIPGHRVHQVRKLLSKTCWTLFSVGPKQAKWGYLEKVRQRWVYTPYDEKELADGTEVKVFGTCKWWSEE